MVTPAQYDLLVARKKCRCGGKLIFDGRLYICGECGRLFCPQCFGSVIPAGGCFNCLSCGFGLCG